MAVKTILLPVGFEERAIEDIAALTELMTAEERVVVLQHVVDEVKMRAAADVGDIDAKSLIERARSRAEAQLREIGGPLEAVGIEVTRVVSVGVPYQEILKISEDLVVDMIVISRIGESPAFDSYIFGGTTEKVTRLARCPVLILPPRQHTDVEVEDG